MPLESCLALDIILLETADILLAGAGVAAAGVDGVGVVTFSLVSLGFPSSIGAHTFNFSCRYKLNSIAFLFSRFHLAVLR